MKRNVVYNQEVKEDGGVSPAGCGVEDANLSDDNVAGTDDKGADTLAEERSEAEPSSESSMEAEAAEWRDKYLRLQAEFDNFRKRTIREKLELIENGGTDVLKAMLTVLDDVQRAVEASEKSDDINALREGEKLVAQKFCDVLRQRGVTEIEAVGKEFDSDLHEAVAKFPAPEKSMKGKVIDVVQRGYKSGDKVLRYAKVVVGE